VRERVRTRRLVVLLVDVWGWMKGERVQTTAATVGALAGELSHDAHAGIDCWSGAAVLLRLGQEVKPMVLLDAILQMPARGLTNVAFPLELAAAQQARVPTRESRVICCLTAFTTRAQAPGSSRRGWDDSTFSSISVARRTSSSAAGWRPPATELRISCTPTGMSPRRSATL